MTIKNHGLTGRLSASIILFLYTLAAVAGVCPFATGHYKDNVLVATIGVSTITVSRDGVSATKSI